MIVYEAEIPRSSVGSSFALPPLPLEIADQYRVMRLHVKACGCPMWYRRDGEEIDPRMSYRIGSGGTQTIDDPALIPLLRFSFDPESAVRPIESEPSLRLVYEGLDQTAWIKERREMTAEEFAQPIKEANAGNEQMRPRNCVDVVRSSNPGVPIPQAAHAASQLSDEERAVNDRAREQMLSRAGACVAAVTQAKLGRP